MFSSLPTWSWALSGLLCLGKMTTHSVWENHFAGQTADSRNLALVTLKDPVHLLGGSHRFNRFLPHQLNQESLQLSRLGPRAGEM